ncbi:hypothetical protein NMK71_06315 [Weeksellaceae bacterium KMM 9713]|uniref:Uncharacterized protein n=1 Tax=Profundicola chukchiensis TaxID=2961959 RepID=A0A9X4MZS5_9FLAO|nr:hypothetical protein [Profundicola chukchiensis]MDG4946022.1 hypothetical protein [Profundicola chukchiensis]
MAVFVFSSVVSATGFVAGVDEAGDDVACAWVSVLAFGCAVGLAFSVLNK